MRAKIKNGGTIGGSRDSVIGVDHRRLCGG